MIYLDSMDMEHGSINHVIDGVLDGMSFLGKRRQSKKIVNSGKREYKDGNTLYVGGRTVNNSTFTEGSL